jgi:hypothetical protein
MEPRNASGRIDCPSATADAINITAQTNERIEISNLPAQFATTTIASLSYDSLFS